MSESVLRQIKDRVASFPNIPGSAAKLLTLLQDPQADIGAIETVLRTDPGLTANILRLTNSSYFGFSSRIGSIKQALTLLGHQRLKQLVMVSCVNSIMNRAVTGYDLGDGELWKHSIAVSVAAEGLVAEAKIDQQPEIFTAALLHDLGKLVLGSFVADNAAAIGSAAQKTASYTAAERAVLGIDHAEAGALLLEQWALPEPIVDTARWHHEPDAAPTNHPMIDVVHLADGLCLMAGIGIGREGLQYPLSPQATARIGLGTIQIERVASRTIQWMTEMADIQQQREKSA